MKLQAGDLAPGFTVPLSENAFLSLEAHRGKKVVLYFYPKDNTPGCTQQACDFKENLSHFNDKNCVVIGISKDSPQSHQKFSKKYDLPFYLGSDPQNTVASLYGVFIEKTLYGRTYKGTDRSTFLIDEKGYIEKVWRSVKVKNHVTEILKCLSPAL